MQSMLAFVLMLSGAATPSFAPELLWKAWPTARFVPTPAPCLDHATLVAHIEKLEARHPGRLSVQEVGRSVEGRAIHLLSLGRGPRRVLLWSQMHGDEPSATPALLDMADYLLSSRDPAALALLEGTTLLLLPLLNPDGAERYSRSNAQAIDINRDALRLATPEARVLKAVRDRFRPELGFNLHDQDRRTTVGETGRLATVALLAVAGDAVGTMTPGRARARRVCAAIARSLQPFVPGGVARYDEDWNPRAFGDNITAWGTPVVLMETGGLPPGLGYADLTRLNFVGLLSALSLLVKDDLADEDPVLYESLERNNDGDWVDVLVSGGTVWQPGAGPPYRADVAFDRLDTDPVAAGCDDAVRGPSTILEIGDGHLLHAGRTVDATGRLVVPAFARLGPGDFSGGVARRGGPRRPRPSGRGNGPMACGFSRPGERQGVGGSAKGPGTPLGRGGRDGERLVPPGSGRAPVSSRVPAARRGTRCSHAGAVALPCLRAAPGRGPRGVDLLLDR